MGTWNCRVHSQPKRARLEVEIYPRKSTLERISSYVPIAISIIALATAIHAQWQAMNHNKLSVRPHVGFLVEDNFEASGVGLFVENNGLGPARIERLTVYLDGHLVGVRDLDSIHAKNRIIFRNTSPQWYTSEYAFNLKSGERLGVFFSPPSNIKNVSAFQELVDKRIFVIGEACSLYDECNYFCSRGSNDECLLEERKYGTPPSSKRKKDALF
jgi:hypothetical protein